ncbi:hypothetical protein APSETT444_006105 [Aspergillus pseudonomiae]
MGTSNDERWNYSETIPQVSFVKFALLRDLAAHLQFWKPLGAAFLKNTLPSFAKANPQIEIRVSPRPHKHPVIKGHYINGREKAVCVRNLEPEQIFQKANLLKEASGEKLKRTKKPVTSINESVRGIWSPYHGDVKTV